MTTTQQKNTQHKKRFGQYYSGKKVADLLFSLLPEGREWQTAVDPMAGIGDMLVSVAEHSPNAPIILGVEIDEAVAAECAKRLPKANILAGDAFKCPNLITPDGWELVITNPPYVRYQLQNNDDGIMPSAQEIRRNLIRQIESISYLSDADKALFLNLAKNYSGMADMALPAWILCAALVKKSGYLAVVVPETWINRDYASPIQYLLTKCFRIETIVRDMNACWFPDALVKTCLVVARREEMRTLADSESIITRIVEADREYAQPTQTLFPHLKMAKDIQKLASSDDISFFSDDHELPHSLAELIRDECNIMYVTLSELGIQCSQGLRTGANEFFYVTIKEDKGDTFLAHSKTWDRGGKEYRFAKNDVVLTLQNRREIEGLVVSPRKLTTGVIYPLGIVHGEMNDYIAAAEEYRDARGRHFKDLSAVRPNEKKDGDLVIREWFRLPKMAQRHLPDLCLTRVAGRIPECLYVCQTPEVPIAVDANMVTFWGGDKSNILIMMAMLNSTWSKLSLELICTVMGGGALKIEASHLRKLLIPNLPKPQLDSLEMIGATLVASGDMTEDIQDQIDNIIASVFEDETLTKKMRYLLAQKYKERSHVYE